MGMLARLAAQLVPMLLQLLHFVTVCGKHLAWHLTDSYRKLRNIKAATRDNKMPF